jgi:hypothetical protein
MIIPHIHIVGLRRLLERIVQYPIELNEFWALRQDEWEEYIAFQLILDNAEDLIEHVTYTSMQGWVNDSSLPMIILKTDLEILRGIDNSIDQDRLISKRVYALRHV